jgi:chromosome segregation ATPase
MFSFHPRGLDHEFAEIHRKLNRLIERDTRIMAGITELDVEIKGELTTAVNAIDQKVTDLEAAIAAGTDTSAQIAELHNLAASINTTLNPPSAPPTATTPTA